MSLLQCFGPVPFRTHRAAVRQTDGVSGSTGSAYPAPDLLSAVSQAYELTAPLRAQRLSGGYANDVFLLDGARPVVLHVKHPPLDLESLSWEHHLQQLLVVQLPEVPAPLPARDGRTFLLHQQRPVWLTPYVPGVPAGLIDRRAVAAALGRVHSIQIDVPVRPGHQRLSDLPIPPIRQMPAAFDSWLPLIAEARSYALEVISHIAKTRSVAVGVTHNDIFPGNVLVEDGQVTALLDWEEADIDWLVWDLASSIGPFCSTSDGALDDSATKDFVNSYRAAGGPVPPEEDDLIVPLMRIKRILEVLRAPTDRHPRWDYQLANLHSYQLLD
jgi:Ser/Thr protein kinase RdoA (MazF antagonist)